MMAGSLCALALGVILYSFGLSGTEVPGDACITEACHETVYNEGTSNPFIHTPFEEKQCDKCHLKTAVVSANSDASLDKSLSQPVILSQPDYQTEHLVVLRGLDAKASYDIAVSLYDTSGNNKRREFRAVVPADVLDVRTDDRTAPQILDVRVGPATKGVFLETSVSWKTDEPATSGVEYGLTDQYGQHTPEDSALVKNHIVNIHELEQDKNYHLRVVSRDPFGNEAESRDVQFQTRDVQPAGVSAEVPAGQDDENALRFDRLDMFLLDSELAFYVQGSKSARLTIAYLKVEEPAAQGTTGGAISTADDSHVALREGVELTINACYQCHPVDSLGVSHPVGVRPSAKTTIPDDLPTLEGGMVTCVTCHTPHGGERRYFARKEITKDICVSCHEGY